MVEKNKKITERKPARPRFVWFKMQWLKLGKAELTSTLLALAVATHGCASQRQGFLV